MDERARGGKKKGDEAVEQRAKAFRQPVDAAEVVQTGSRQIQVLERNVRVRHHRTPELLHVRALRRHDPESGDGRREAQRVEHERYGKRRPGVGQPSEESPASETRRHRHGLKRVGVLDGKGVEIKGEIAGLEFD